MNQTVKSTINISAQLKEEMISYVQKGKISSLSYGVNAAIELYLKELKKSEYAEKLIKASQDKEFVKRTMECQRDFEGNAEEDKEEW